jgi:hypothetical protein
MDDLDPMLDAMVVTEVRAGNRQAYGMLIDRYQVRLRAALSACLQHSDEIEEFTRRPSSRRSSNWSSTTARSRSIPGCVPSR